MRGLELVISGNNRSAIRALKEVADQSGRTSSEVARDSERTSAGFRRVGESAQRTRGHIGGLLGLAGLGGLGFGLKSVISAGLSWQTQQDQLQVALKNTGNRSSETRRKILDAAEALSTKGGFGATQTLQGMTQFVRLNGNASDAISKVTLATNIARGSGKEFTQVLRALMMAENGRTTGLARLGIPITKVTTAQDALRTAHLKGKDALLALTAAGYKFTTAQKAQYALTQQITPAMLAQAKAQDALATKSGLFGMLQLKYGGATSAFSAGTAGKISNAQNALDIATKTMSQKLLPVIAKLATGIAVVITYLMAHKSILIALGVTIAGVTAILTAHRIVIEVLRAKTYLLSGAQQLLGITTRGAATATGDLAATAGTAAPAVGRLGVASTGAAGKMAAVGSGLVGLAGKIAAGYLALQIFNSAKQSIAETGRRFNRGIYGKGGVVQGGVQDYLQGRQGFTGPGLLAKPRSMFNNPINNLLNKFLGVGGNSGGLLHGFGLLNAGGPVKPRYYASGGPVGMDTIPGWLTPGEGVVTTRGMSQLGSRGLAMLNTGRPASGQPITVNLTVPVKINDREIARAVTRHVIDAAARGPSSLTGGSLVSGAPGLPA